MSWEQVIWRTSPPLSSSPAGEACCWSCQLGSFVGLDRSRKHFLLWSLPYETSFSPRWGCPQPCWPSGRSWKHCFVNRLQDPMIEWCLLHDCMRVNWCIQCMVAVCLFSCFCFIFFTFFLLQIIYVFRNPKDVLVSMYHFHKISVTIETPKDFDTFLEKFLVGKGKKILSVIMPCHSFCLGQESMNIFQCTSHMEWRIHPLP